jgi:hypothetical protein
MNFYDKEFKPTVGYARWRSYIDQNLTYKLAFTNTRILLIHLFDYRAMHENGTLDSYVAKAVDFKIDFVILEDPHNYPEVPEYAKTSPIKTFLLHNDFELFENHESNKLYWPVWLFFVQDKTEVVPTVTADYILSSANRNFNYGRPGKIYNYQKLKTKSYFDQILFTKFRTEDSLCCPWPHTHIDHEFGKILDEFILDFNSWPLLDNDLFEGMAALNLNVYNKSLFHLVAESGVKENIISEKTYKIFYVKQIPIMCGAKNTVSHLRNLGFDMFDDIIDHNVYDGIDDFKRRIDAMHTVLDSVITLDHKQLLEKTKHRRNSNYNWLYSQDLTNLIVKPLLDQLLVYKKAIIR